MNRWDIRYRAGEMGDKAPEPLIAEAAALAGTPGEALDVACGTGRHSVVLAGLGWRVTCVDYSEVALSILQKRNAGVHIVRTDLEADSIDLGDECYDLVVDAFFLCRQLFTVMRRALRPGGIFCGIFPTEGLNPAYLMQEGEAGKLFAEWEILHLREGRPAPGRRARAEIVARKPVR